MSATNDLFTRWKAHMRLQSDREAAAKLGLSHGAPHLWRTGRNGSAAVIERMAKDLGEDPVPVILQAFAEAARDAEDKRTLGRLARRLGAACVALLALAPWMMPSSANAATEGNEEAPRLIHYAQLVRRAVRLILARWRSLTAPRLQPPNLEPYAWNRFASSPANP